MVKLEENNSFFQSDEWKNYVTKDYEETDTPPPKSFMYTPPKQSIYWNWKGEGKQPSVGNYYCIAKKHTAYVQYQMETYTICDWILVGKSTKKKPFERELTPEEEELYNTYRKELKRIWNEKEPEREQERKKLEKEYEEKAKQRIKEDSFKKEKAIVYNKVGEKAGTEAVYKFIAARDTNPEIPVEEFLRTNYEITSGGKRRTTRKGRKSKTNR